MKLRLRYGAESIVVTTERAARAWAREKLGVDRVYETPTNSGWQLWPESGDDNDPHVTVTVL